MRISKTHCEPHDIHSHWVRGRSICRKGQGLRCFVLENLCVSGIRKPCNQGRLVQFRRRPPLPLPVLFFIITMAAATLASTSVSATLVARTSGLSRTSCQTVSGTRGSASPAELMACCITGPSWKLSLPLVKEALLISTAFLESVKM